MAQTMILLSLPKRFEMRSASRTKGYAWLLFKSEYLEIRNGGTNLPQRNGSFAILHSA